MKRNFLEQFELSKEQINTILDENGKDLEAKDLKINQLQTELKQTEQEVSDYKERAEIAENLQSQLDETSTELEDLKKQIKHHKIERALIDNGATDIDYLKYKLGDIEVESDDFSTRIEELKEELPNFFRGEKIEEVKPSKGYKVVDNKLDTGEVKPKMTRKEILAIEDVSERQKAIEDNFELFN